MAFSGKWKPDGSKDIRLSRGKPSGPARSQRFRGKRLHPSFSPRLVKPVIDQLRAAFKGNFRGLILYGSWAKGTARSDSDIDLLTVLERISSKASRTISKIEAVCSKEHEVSIVLASRQDFGRESLPLYTAAKREGRILWGKADLTVNPEKPSVKYKQAHQKSKDFELGKIRMAEEILEKHPSYGSSALCFSAAKHGIQMALAMRGVGYSSKLSVLLPLTETFFGPKIARAFRNLVSLYIKSEYQMEFLTPKESARSVEYAKQVATVYDLIP